MHIDVGYSFLNIALCSCLLFVSFIFRLNWWIGFLRFVLKNGNHVDVTWEGIKMKKINNRNSMHRQGRQIYLNHQPARFNIPPHSSLHIPLPLLAGAFSPMLCSVILPISLPIHTIKTIRHQHNAQESSKTGEKSPSLLLATHIHQKGKENEWQQ